MSALALAAHISGRRTQLRGVSPPRPGWKCGISMGLKIKSKGLFSLGLHPLNSWDSWLTGVPPGGLLPGLSQQS